MTTTTTDAEYWKNDQANRSSVRGDYSAPATESGPFEVESALLEHASVAESAVVSSSDEIRGEIAKAFVVLKSGFTASEALAAELQDQCKKVTAAYKYPRKIDFVTSLPKTVSGKIRRIELRNREWGRPIPPTNERE